MFISYVLFSRSAERYYIGSTHDLENRLREHNAGECHSTRGGVPWNVVWAEEFDTRSGAVGRERQIKARGARRFLEGLHKGESG